MLPPSTRSRASSHLRTVAVESFECEDGTIELELRLVDQKRFGFVDRERGKREPGAPVHGINVRVSINRDLEVLNIETDLEFMPFSYCQGGSGNASKLIGKQLDRGWRRSVREAMGSTHGCTHLAELLCLAPTVAFQTTAIGLSSAGRALGAEDATHTEPPFFIGGCFSWAPDSPITEKYFPQFRAGDAKDENDQQ